MEKQRGEDLIEELYSLLAELLNSKQNRKWMDSIRGEFGVLRYLDCVEDGVTPGVLNEQLHVVPGRVTDILRSLEKKKAIVRMPDEKDRRKVRVFLTEEGHNLAAEKRAELRKEYMEMFQTLGESDTEELIRLLKIALSYKS